MKGRLFTAVVLFFSYAAVSAQSADTAISDEELKRYAVMMDSIDEMRIGLLAEISDMVKDNDSITVARYNDLSKIIDDDAKLAAANATPEEIAVIKKVQAVKEAGTAEIQGAFKEIAKGYVGAETYNKVRKALKSDADVKSKYEAMMDELKADNGG